MDDDTLPLIIYPVIVFVLIILNIVFFFLCRNRYNKLFRKRRQHEAEESLKQPHPPYFMGQIYHIQPSSTEPPEGLEEVVYPRQPSPSLPGAPPAMPVTHEVPPSYASLFQPIDKGLKAKEID